MYVCMCVCVCVCEIQRAPAAVIYEAGILSDCSV